LRRRRTTRPRSPSPIRERAGVDKYLSRDLAFAKLRALVEGARIIRERL
jgi:hypothetical protein